MPWSLLGSSKLPKCSPKLPPALLLITTIHPIVFRKPLYASSTCPLRENAVALVLNPFATLFQSRTWIKAQLLLVGAILAPGQRTVASALRVMGRSDDRNYARYHHVLNRAVWSPLQVSQVLLTLLIQHLDQGDGPLVFGIDETVERRGGPKIKARGIYRDAVRSSRSYLVKVSGLRWICLMWLGHVPWAGRYWALPVLTVWYLRPGITASADGLTKSSPIGPSR